jgi:hypothetical protein
VVVVVAVNVVAVNVVIVDVTDVKVVDVVMVLRDGCVVGADDGAVLGDVVMAAVGADDGLGEEGWAVEGLAVIPTSPAQLNPGKTKTPAVALMKSCVISPTATTRSVYPS